MIIGTLPNADENNLIPVGEDAQGVTTEALTDTDQRYIFTVHGGTGLVEGIDDLPDTSSVLVGLMERSGTAGPWSFVAADCALWYLWERDIPHTGKAGTVTEKWGTFGAEIVSARRLNVDVGYSRPGVRVSLGLNGPDYEGWVIDEGEAAPRAIVSAPSGGFLFPLRLVMSVSATGVAGAAPFEVRDIVLEGQIGQKATLSAENKIAWGVTTADLHLRIFERGVVPGAPVDIDL